jgi:transcriptional regulator GlxA family with amidase domain
LSPVDIDRPLLILRSTNPSNHERGLRRRRGPIDSLVVVGGAGAERAAGNPGLCRDVVALGRRAHRTVSVCSGVLVLASAGLLDDRRVTTHGETVDELADRHPGVVVEGDRIYVQDGDV